MDKQVYSSGGKDRSDDGDIAEAAGQVQINTHEADSLLDEIDTLLETDSEEFVKSYVQKGGQ
ncbi:MULTISPECIES: ubiquitin-like protein Pup [Corynebacterium]|uniref:Prokaryotic ubiquitin-like protein Pup n=2 Tax=Corynebacterium glucuronolyticum TaxID=39791 RepID=A0A7T4EE78_9CORY|nr:MULTISPECIES: ubiquitin-like protein Pup [Corynebacterium]EEI26435.1 ubiquitin-like protein Pup [Corynebacterium glucuronolyticum ATCC 51867]EEI63090.1 ubiquitin-like protein Pup [Corynebacterium glucuronolyticum ATCC 51866]MCT1442728.1 ubiquitin-like protein Pup [Corynebacterium glucuronolyticum]MCT1562676.1 ubiquitin-like protein Pup [Corynebacterium glucuronolyticum]OFO48330.1 Prokaryotic ubiquitin-like protein Pup [Corynebacterium sp. HMSC073D01]